MFEAVPVSVDLCEENEQEEGKDEQERQRRQVRVGQNVGESHPVGSRLWLCLSVCSFSCFSFSFFPFFFSALLLLGERMQWISTVEGRRSRRRLRERDCRKMCIWEKEAGGVSSGNLVSTTRYGGGGKKGSWAEECCSKTREGKMGVIRTEGKGLFGGPR